MSKLYDLLESVIKKVGSALTESSDSERLLPKTAKEYTQLLGSGYCDDGYGADTGVQFVEGEIYRLVKYYGSSGTSVHRTSTAVYRNGYVGEFNVTDDGHVSHGETYISNAKIEVYGGVDAIQPLDEDYIPDTIPRNIPDYFAKEAANVADAAEETVTAAEFNALLTTLRNAGVIAQPDPWAKLFASIDAGTYATDFAVGDILPLHLGIEGAVNAQIVAFDKDVDSSGNTVPVSFITEHVLNSWVGINTPSNFAYDGYNYWTTGLRETVSNMINLFEERISKRVVPVKRAYIVNDDSASGKSESISLLKLSIPSMKELAVSSWSNEYTSQSAEENGIAYSSVFSDDESRKKTTADGVACEYCTRTAGTDAYRYKHVGVIGSGGTPYGMTVDNTAGIVLCFCVG